MWRITQLLAIVLTTLLTTSHAFLTASQNRTSLTLQNDRLLASVNTSTGAINVLTLDGLDMLGKPNGAQTAIGPYMDCVCTPAQNNYTPGGSNATYTLLQGTDSFGIAWGGMVMSQKVPNTGGEIMEQYWFLRETETSLHMFTRLAYYNSTTPFLADLQALRTLYRPITPLWTHLSSTDDFSVPQPNPNPATDLATGDGIAKLVQDTTWDLSNRTNDPYVNQVSSYFTKYTLSTSWRNQKVHGLFSDGTTSPDNTTYGAWTIMNTKDTYFGGPTYSDL